jgi:hypothetical protein
MPVIGERIKILLFDDIVLIDFPQCGNLLELIVRLNLKPSSDSNKALHMIYKVFVTGVNGFRNFEVRRVRIRLEGLRVHHISYL